MGGVDKGLQAFRGQPLALHALQRLQPQVGALLLSANRHIPAYEALARPFGAPVLSDALQDYAGPLAGFLAGLERCRTPWLLTVPCDSPLFPADLAARLAQAAEREGADIALAAAPEDGTLRPQPVFCLLRTRLRESLLRYMGEGGRKIGAWAAQHHRALEPFDRPGDDPRAFHNANTLAELHALESPA